MVEYTVTVTSNTAYNGSSNSTTYTATVGSLSLAQGSILDLGDVVVSSLADGEVLAYEASSGNFVNVSNAGGGGGGASELDDLTDVTITTLGADELLFTQDGSTFINQTLSEAGIQGVLSEGAFVDGDKTKLDGIEASADVTDTANVTAAGALMDSEVTNLAQVKAFDSSDYATAAQGALADSATQPGDNISTLTNDAGFITATLTTEQVQDIAGGMFSGNTETLITATYQDADGTIDLVVDNDLSNYDNSSSGFITGITSEPLGDLSDVTITTLGTDELLFTQDGSTWINQTLTEAGISAVGHSHATSDITSGTFADARISESSVTQHEAALTITESQISDLDHDALKLRGIGLDTTVGSPTDGKILVYRSAGSDWVLEDKPAGGSNPAINDVTDVTITSVADNEVLAYNSGTSEWINQTAAEAGLAAASHTHATSDITSGTFADARIAESNVTQHEAALTITESQISDLGTYLTDITGENISSLNDVTITTVADNEVLAYNAATSTWINQTASEAGLATSAQGALADSATQPGDNISTLTNDSGFITATLTEEQVEDFVGGMVTGNTETFISVTYQDADGTLDFVVPVLDEDNMASDSAAHLATQQSIKAYVDANAGGFTQEEIEDFVGAMVGGASVQTLITVSYDDTNGELDFVVDNNLSNYSNTTTGFISDITGESIADLSNVTITTLGADELLFTQDGSTWVNQTLAEAGIQAQDDFLDDIAALTDPNADRLMFWDDSAGTITWLTAGTGLTVSGTTITPRAASTSQTGIVELAIASEVDTGTSTTLAVTPDALAGSNLGEKSFCIAVYDSSTDVATGDGTIGFCVPASMAGMNIVEAHATVHTAGTTGTTDVQIRRRRDTTDADVLSTKLTIDSGETRSTTAATAYVVNGTNDDLAAGDMIYVDVDAISTTAPKGLSVTITARLP